MQSPSLKILCHLKLRAVCMMCCVTQTITWRDPLQSNTNCDTDDGNIRKKPLLVPAHLPAVKYKNIC